MRNQHSLATFTYWVSLALVSTFLYAAAHGAPQAVEGTVFILSLLGITALYAVAVLGV